MASIDTLATTSTSARHIATSTRVRWRAVSRSWGSRRSGVADGDAIVVGAREVVGTVGTPLSDGRATAPGGTARAPDGGTDGGAVAGSCSARDGGRGGADAVPGPVIMATFQTKVNVTDKESSRNVPELVR